MAAIKRRYAEQAFVLFDVGANLGDYTDTMMSPAKTGHTAHLFEPQPTCVATLTKRFTNNAGIIINPFALSDQTGTAILYSDREQSPVASLYPRDLSYHAVALSTQQEISLQTAKNYIDQNKVPHINLLKIDVEGHELSALKGFGDFLSPQNIDFIQFEYGGTNLDAKTTLKEIHHLLSSRGFVVCKLMRRHLEVKAFTPELENFRYQNWVAVAPNILQEKVI
jgi:FkbM family methyltransferase